MGGGKHRGRGLHPIVRTDTTQLAVIIAAISQRHSSLALGNILGSSISNILGAFSLGLLFQADDVTFDRSSKIYTGLTLAFTTVLVLYLFFFKSMGSIAGAILVISFLGYVASIAYYIYKGVMAAPEDDDDDDDDDDSDDGASDSDDESETSDDTLRDPKKAPTAMTLLDIEKNSSPSPTTHKKPPRSTAFHIAQLLAGFLALSLSGYILSHSVSAIADAFSLSGTVLGITVLSIATTLPEKFVAICSGARGEHGIVVANTAGSNIFLLTLCAGVLFLAGDFETVVASVSRFDLAAVWVSSLLFFLVVFFGAKRWMGGVLLSLYLVFIGVEFAFFTT